jgi:hypothetical protein
VRPSWTSFFRRQISLLTITGSQLVGIDGICLVLVAVVIYFTRAAPKRVFGAVVAGSVATAIGIGFDVVGDAMGWWHYTMVRTPYGPPLMYVALGLWYGVGVTLIGWRVIRRFRRRGLIAFIGFMAVYGPLRDYAASPLTKGTVQVISPDIMPLVDMALWASLKTVAQGIMWLVAGSPDADRLARARKLSHQ